MKKQPFFSITIPTYNRSNFLFLVLKSILSQTFSDFEIIISDNNSIDDTKAIVDSFKDKRIKYYKNKQNIGCCRNQEQALYHSQGKYIIFQSDDDFLTRDDALMIVWKKLQQKQYGFVRMHYINKTPDNKKFFYCNPKLQKDFYIDSHADVVDIFNFCDNININFFTGIVIRNDYPKNIRISYTEIAAWFNICYYNIEKYGGYFLSDAFFLCRWSTTGLTGLYQLDNGKIPSELYLRDVFAKVDYQEQIHQLDKYVMSLIVFLPAVKYFTDNKNLIELAKRIIALAPNYQDSIMLWFYVYISLIAPKIALHWYRFYRINNIKVDYPIRDYDLLKNKLDYLTQEVHKSNLLDNDVKQQLIQMFSS